MAISPKITTENDITLITLQNCPPELSFVSDVFQKIGQFGVDVDMISLAPSQGSNTSISFTISDFDLDKILSFTSRLHDTINVKAIVSSGNCKISVYDPNMVNAPGIAAQVFAAAASANSDIRVITTSEVDISLLVTAADYPETMKALQDKFGV
jgi:aspartate kinase